MDSKIYFIDNSVTSNRVYKQRKYCCLSKQSNTISLFIMIKTETNFRNSCNKMLMRRKIINRYYTKSIVIFKLKHNSFILLKHFFFIFTNLWITILLTFSNKYIWLVTKCKWKNQNEFYQSFHLFFENLFEWIVFKCITFILILS